MMNNIEKLAIEKMIYEHTGFNPNVADDAETIKHIKNLLEAFAKALQQSEPVAEFRRGARAMFDHVLYATANNWHGNPELNKQCDAENAFANNLVINALEEISPADASEWKNIVEMQQEINRLKANPPNTVPKTDDVVKDAERLDFLDAMNKRKNENYGTTYGWLLEENHNRIMLSDHHFPHKTVRQAIDEAMKASKE